MSTSSTSPVDRTEGLTLRQAALIAGFSYLFMPVAFAEFYIFPRLLIPGHIEETAQNIVSHGTLFGVAILCNLVTLILDVVIAWALYILLAPVNKAFSLLAAWFRLMYTAVAFFAALNLVTAFRLLHTPYYVTLFGDQQLQAHVQLALSSFRYGWSISLLIFGIHLGLVGCLIYRSRYIPRLLGIALVVVGSGWVISSLRPYLYPDAPLDFLFTVGFAELLLPLWLVVRGWKIPEPTAAAHGGSAAPTLM